ncbi:hypothetical protein [Bradyrhizobium septentrionale]|nr:hypothetical protein [Bradyrhizobium septentrionale]
MAAKYAKQAAASGLASPIIPHSLFGAFADGEALPVLRHTQIGS